ncbi:MAG: cob(I)yrinic acid a,c-diamide adenosyltransferase [Planctomycetes bacterium]|nr:cob(I)yrinic acid a,c-diamide adenosyltransferase [Planctomycetota bacterium]
MKLYTKTGDDGTTGLFGGDRVGKDHPRVEAYGTVDELNAAVGLAAAAVDPGSAGLDRIAAIFSSLQSRLLDLGADLATPAGSKHAGKVARLDAGHVGEVEGWIDEIDAANEPMTHFVLPGGTDLAARLHLARTICRRAERLLVTLGGSETVTPEAIVYLNRVSDLLFAMARLANLAAGVADVPWVPGKGGP